MNLVVRFSIHLYARLLRLYPSGFLNEFADEMLAVFSAALSDAQKRGRLSLLTWCVWEFASLLTALARERWRSLRREEAVMSQITPINHSNPVNDARSESRLKLFAGIFPFILFGLMYTMDGVIYHIQPSWYIYTTYRYSVVFAIMLLGLGIGWAFDFPRWSFAYLGVVLMTSYFGGWIPLLVLTVVMLLFTRSLQPVLHLFQGMRQDWTLLSFALFAALTSLIMGITYDGKSWYNQTLYLPLNLFLITLVITGGAFLYMVNQRPWSRVQALTAALILYMPVSALVTALDGHREFGSPSAAIGWLSYLLFLLLMMAMPLLPGITRHLWLRFRPI